MDIKYRVPLLLFHLEGYTQKEISHLLALPTGTVKSRISRAKDQLRTLLKDEEVFRDEAL